MKQELNLTKEHIKYRLTLSIFGDFFNIDELVALTKIKATNIYRKGDKGRYSFYKESSWDYIIVSKELDLENLTNKILNLFNSEKKVLSNFIVKNNLSIKICVEYYIHDSIVPSLYLDKVFLKFLSDLKCEIDFDGFICSY